MRLRRGRKLGWSRNTTIFNGAQLAWWLAGMVGISSLVLVSSGTMPGANAAASNQNEYPSSRISGKTPPFGVLSLFSKRSQRPPQP